MARMTKKSVSDPREQAIADQLRAEIAASRWKKIRTFARALDESGTHTDYTSFYLRANGKAPLPTDVLLAALDLLGVDYLTFVQAAMRRNERPNLVQPVH